MNRFHVAVWVDHHHARIVGIGLDSADVRSITEHGEVRHVHRKADHIDEGKAPIDETFLGEVALALKPAKAILICGPGTARTALAGYLNEKVPALAKRVWGIKPMDHPTDGELVAAARKFFAAPTPCMPENGRTLPAA